MPPSPPLARLAVCVLALAAAPARAELGGGLRLSVNAGVDTNARRDFDQVDKGTAADMVASVVGSTDGHYQGERALLAGSYDIGVRKFMRLPLEDVFIQSAALEASVAVGPYLGLGLEGRAKDRRGGERDYTDLAAFAFVELVPDAAVSLRVHGGGHRFLFPSDLQFSFKATEWGFTGRYRFDKRHSLLAFGDLGFRAYNAAARVDPSVENPPRRTDSLITAGAGYSFRGPFAFSATYSYTEQASNSLGSSSMRHRLTVTGALRLPLSVTLLAQATLQLSRYPVDYPSEELVLLDDDENHNAVSVKLVRPISEHIDVELRYALYQNRLPNEGLTYLRQVAWAGLGWRL